MRQARPDQRREVGQRTRARLMDAALELLADRGEESVTLRELTAAAEANVAAVSYHFGSLKALCDAAVEQALERYLQAQEEAVSALDADATIEDLAVAFARPMISSVVAGGRELAVMRIVARAGIDPPEGWDRLSARFNRIRARAVRVLKANVRGVGDRELAFRTRCVAGLMNWLVLAPIGEELRGRSQKEIERSLVPVLTGAFMGASPAGA